MKNLIIRKSGVDDLGDVLRINFDLFKKEHKEFDKSLNMKWTYGKEGKNYFKKRLAEKKGFVWLLKIMEK